MSKKVEAERLGKWLKDPVTRVYLEAVKDLNNETANECASGGCNGSAQFTISEMYQNYMGQLFGIQRCYDAAELMRRFGYIQDGSDE
jgi:hypothetical protein